MTARGAARALFHVGPAAVWTLCIFFVGAIPVQESPPGSLGDKWLHAIVFGLYVPWLVLADRHLRPAVHWPARIWAGAVASSAVGMLLEIWQIFWPPRTAEFMDWVADTVGALVVGVFLALIHAIFSRLFVASPAERAPPSA